MSDINDMLSNIKEKFLKSNRLEWIEKIFFSLFILSIPFQTRLTFLTPETFVNGRFNEYGTFFIYLSDILLLITFIAYFVNRLPRLLISCRTFDLNNIINKTFFVRQKNKNDQNNFILTKRGIISIITHNLSTSPQLIPILFIFAFVVWSFLGVIWAQYHDIVLYRSFKLLELFLLLIYVKERLYWFSISRLVVLVFIDGISQSVIGLFQYLYQHSLGLKLLGESVLAPNIDNVAKIIIDSNRIIRAYGTFPHPNIFAAFLILSIFSGIWLLLSLRRSELGQIVSRLPAIASTSNAAVQSKQDNKIVSRETISAGAKEGETISNESSLDKLNYKKTIDTLIKLFHVKQFEQERKMAKQFKQNQYIFYVYLVSFGIILQIYVLILTYSRLAWLGLVVAVVLLIVYFVKYSLIVSCLPSVASDLGNLSSKKNDQIVSRETISILAGLINWFLKLFHVKQFDRDCQKMVQSNLYGLDRILKISLVFIVVGVTVIVGSYWNVIVNRTVDVDQNYQQSFDNRVLYKDIAFRMINDKPLSGVGNGNFTLVMAKYTENPLEWWQYQPVHNIYLLIASELGIVGILLFMGFVIWLLANISCMKCLKIDSRLPTVALVSNSAVQSKQDIKIVSRETILIKYILGSVFLAFMIIALFDHYFWSFQQGQLIFWLVAGTLLALNNTEQA